MITGEQSLYLSAKMLIGDTGDHSDLAGFDLDKRFRREGSRQSTQRVPHCSSAQKQRARHLRPGDEHSSLRYGNGRRSRKSEMRITKLLFKEISKLPSVEFCSDSP